MNSDEKSNQYRVVMEKQLEEWVKGNSLHSDKIPDHPLPEGFSGECTPDFSCCYPELRWSEDIRKSFQKADRNTRLEMLGMSLAGLVSHSHPEKVIHIVGHSPKPNDNVQ